MARVVNLNRFRKQKLREEKDRQAEANRQKFGRTKDERARVEKENELQQRRLDAKRRIPASDEDPGDELPHQTEEGNEAQEVGEGRENDKKSD